MSDEFKLMLLGCQLEYKIVRYQARGWRLR